PAFLWNVFIAAVKGDRLEGNESNLLGVVHREANDRPDLVVIHPIDECYHKNDFNPRFVEIVDRPQLDVEQIANLAMAIRVVANAVKLQIAKPQTGFRSLAAQIFALGELDP